MRTIYTFFKLDQGGLAENSTLDTCTIMADDYESAFDMCKKQFIPDSYHALTLSIIDTVGSLDTTRLPAMIANNDDIKEC